MSTFKELRPNVGFIIRELPGYTRTIDIDLPPDVTLGDDLLLRRLQGELLLARTQQGVWVDGKVEATVPAECSRCLEPFDLDLRLQFQEMFYSPPGKAPSSQDYVVQESGVMDLNEPIRELIQIAVPIQSVCRPDCQGLCSHCGQNLNEGTCSCEDELIDPRMAALLELKKNLSEG
jgi:uncharacterized protein